MANGTRNRRRARGAGAICGRSDRNPADESALYRYRACASHGRIERGSIIHLPNADAAQAIADKWAIDYAPLRFRYRRAVGDAAERTRHGRAGYEPPEVIEENRRPRMSGARRRMSTVNEAARQRRAAAQRSRAAPRDARRATCGRRLRGTALTARMNAGGATHYATAGAAVRPRQGGAPRAHIGTAHG